MATNSQGYVYTNTYSDMRGVDFSTEASQIPDHRFSYLENMYRDYAAGAAAGVETIPGFRKAAAVVGKIRAMHPHPTDRKRMLIHAGTALYSFRTEEENGAFPAPEEIPLTGFSLAAAESRSTVLDGGLYLVDGQSFSVYNGTAVRRAVTTPYVPCLYIDGEPYEQKNLLVGMGYEKYHLFDLDALRYETDEGISYLINYEGLCFVSKYVGNEETVVIPREIVLNERRHTVAGISTDAFRGNGTVKTLVLPEGLTRLSASACYGMTALETVVLPASLAEIETSCFEGCPFLKNVYLGRGLRKIHANAFRGCNPKQAYYAGSAVEYMAVDGYEQLSPNHVSGITLRYMSVYSTVRYRLPIHIAATSYVGESLDGGSFSLYPSVSGHVHYKQAEDGNRYIDYYYLESTNETALYGKTFSLCLTWQNALPAEIRSVYPGYTWDAQTAINGCTLIASFDGRLFLSGNPKLPGLVFYSARRSDGTHDATYIGEYNRILDGDGATKVRALLPTPSFLLVLTEGAPHASSVFRHEGQDTESDLVPRVYPVVEGAGEVGCIGDAVLFYNDPLFLSKNGLEAVEAVSFSLSQERRTVHRSEAVDAKLCREDLTAARFFRFGTYLGIATKNGRVYLADGRERAQKNANTGYDWYYLSDIGIYRDQVPRYRTVAGELPEALRTVTVPVYGRQRTLLLTDKPEYTDGETVLSATVNGISFCYVIRGAYPYLVDTDGEYHGGSFEPASAFLECNDLLFFGTPTGDIMVFNTDKRGEDGVIPRRYYTFNNRAYLSGCATKSDNCKKPNYRKSTLRTGGAVKLKSMSGGKIAVRVRTDLGVWREADTLYGGRLDFSETDFAAAEFHSAADTVVPLRIGAKRWIEQQIYFVSEEYQRPFGIISFTYRYRTAGRI